MTSPRTQVVPLAPRRRFSVIKNKKKKVSKILGFRSPPLPPPSRRRACAHTTRVAIESVTVVTGRSGVYVCIRNRFISSSTGTRTNHRYSRDPHPPTPRHPTKGSTTRQHFTQVGYSSSFLLKASPHHPPPPSLRGIPAVFMLDFLNNIDTGGRPP